METTLKSTGIIRPLDEVGRIVLPKELRKTLNLNHKDPLEIFTSGNSIILKKHEPVCCIFCGSTEKLVSLDDKSICTECVKKLNSKIR